MHLKQYLKSTVLNAYNRKFLNQLSKLLYLKLEKEEQNKPKPCRKKGIRAEK